MLSDGSVTLEMFRFELDRWNSSIDSTRESLID